MLVTRANLKQTTLPILSILLPAMIVAVGHCAATIGLFRADVNCLLLTARIHLTFLLRVHKLLVVP